MLYWDNAATTWPKPAPVIQAVTGALTRFGANPGRGGHTMGMEASQEVYRCRETAARLFHLENPGNVVFTLNCTMSLNFAIKGILRGGGRVVVSDMEHNAVMRPLYALSPGTAAVRHCRRRPRRRRGDRGEFPTEHHPFYQGHCLYPGIQCVRRAASHSSARGAGAGIQPPVRGGRGAVRRGFAAGYGGGQH